MYNRLGVSTSSVPQCVRSERGWFNSKPQQGMRERLSSVEEEAEVDDDGRFLLRGTVGLSGVLSPRRCIFATSVSGGETRG